MMTPRERWLAALRMEPVDRLPFWPKLDGAYPKAQRAPFNEMTSVEIHQWIGSDQHGGVPGCVKEIRTKTSLEEKRNNGHLVTRFKTPHAELRMVRQYDGPSHSWHPIEFPVKTREDIEVMTEWFRDCRVELDEEGLEKAKAHEAEVGQDAVLAGHIGESPLMRWVEWFAGVENAHYMLIDNEAEVEALFDAVHDYLKRRGEILCEHSPGDMFYMIENTSTTLISPDQYREYCFGHISDYAEIANSHGRDITLHMCGHLKAILPDLEKLQVRAFEAFTSPPVGNTTLMDGRAHCPSKCLIGGTNATLWTYPAEQIIAELAEHLDALPHHRGIVVTSAGVMPPLASPETIKAVCDWVKAYEPRF